MTARLLLYFQIARFRKSTGYHRRSWCVKAGEPLMDGPRNPDDILDVLGEKEQQKYLVDEIQEVYRLQGVNINDKHLEVIVRQMMRWVHLTKAKADTLHRARAARWRGQFWQALHRCCI